MYSGRKSFRTQPVRILLISAIPIGAGIVAYLTYGSEEDWFVPWFMVGFFVLGVFALVEAVTDFLVLDTHELRFRKSFRSVQIPKTEIETVTWTKGGGVSLKLASGKWVMIPDMGYDSKGLTNSISAWVRSQ